MKRYFLWFVLCVIIQQTQGATVQVDNINQPNKSGHNIYGKSSYSIRPQHSNAARNLLQLSSNNFHYCDVLECYFLTGALEYQRSFNDADLGAWFLWNGKNSITVGPSSTDTPFDLNSLQIGVKNLTNVGQIGTVELSPLVENIIGDISFVVKLNTCWRLWAGVDLTVAYCTTDLNMKCCDDSTSSTAAFTDGLFNFDCTSNLGYASLCQALEADLGFGDIPALDAGKFNDKKMHKGDVSAITLDLGIDLIATSCSYLGISLHYCAPTGNAPKSKYLLEPIVGANKANQLGAMIYGGTEVYKSCNNNISVLFNCTLTHIFESKQERFFALESQGAGSQYLLIKQFDDDKTIVLTANRVANILYGEVNVGNDIMVDAAVMAQMMFGCFFLNIGYNFWLRSKDKLNRNVTLKNFSNNQFGIKGNTPLSCTQEMGCAASTVCGTNLQTASGSTIALSATPDTDITTIDISDIDFSTALHPQATSNKIFASIGRTMHAHELPLFWTIGFEIEIGNGNKALSQWGVAAMLGLAF